MLTTIMRPEDTIRAPRTYRGEASEKTREPVYGSRVAANPDQRPPPLPRQDSFSREEVPQHNSRPPIVSRLLTQEETIELTRHAVDNGLQETQRSLAGSEAVSEVVRPRLTIDLGHSNIVRIPESVVDIIKDDVERYGPVSYEAYMVSESWAPSRRAILFSENKL
jgi:hypothetical protein